MTTTVATKEEVHALMKTNFKTKNTVYAFYTSHLDRIIIDQDQMVVPIYDRQVHRAHSIFDTVDVVKNHLLLLDEHVARMAASCKLVSIPLPMPLEVMREKIKDLASFCVNHYNLEKTDFYIRYWVSSGGENFGILPSGRSIFYIVAFYEEKTDQSKMLKECSVQSLDPKVGVLASAKTTNYLVNALYTIEAKKKGGYLGIMTTKDGIVLEAPVMNVAFVWKNGDFVTSSFDRVLKGTTLIECMNLINEVLVKNGIVKKVVQRDFTLQEVYDNAVEMMLIGGNKILPIGSFDDRIISEIIGTVTIFLQEKFFLQEILHGLIRDPHFPFERYPGLHLSLRPHGEL